jgi:hypothetical protein
MFTSLKTIPIVYINNFEILGKNIIAFTFVKHQRLVNFNYTINGFYCPTC